MSDLIWDLFIVAAVCVAVVVGYLIFIGGYVLNLFPFIIVGSVFFWLLLAAGFLFIGWIVEEEEFGWAVVSFLGLLAAIDVFSNANLLTLIWHNPMKLLVAFGIYVGVGIVWSFARWFLYLHDEFERLHEENSSLFTKLQDAKDAKDDIAFAACAGAIRFRIPTAMMNKERITGWTAFWPWSVTWTLFSDLIRKLYKRIFQFFQNVYENMAKRIFKDVYKLIQ